MGTIKMSFLKGFTSLFDWMFSQTYQEMSDDLDEKMQDLYDKNNWGQYQNPLKYSPFPVNNCSYISATDINRITTAEQNTQTIYASKETLNQLLLDMNKNMPSDIKLTKDQEFAIWWLYDRVAGRFPDKDYIIVNGINITETVRELLKDRLFI
jgi:hypothetical protein